jgi:hypothetical protein
MAVLEPRLSVIPIQERAFRAVKHVPIRRIHFIGPRGTSAKLISACSLAKAKCRNPTAATHSIMATYVEEVLTQCKSST